MRDIRDELSERLKQATARRREFLARARDAEVEEASIRKMLEIEDRRFGDRQKKSLQDLLGESKQKQAEGSLAGFLQSVLEDGLPHSLNGLAEVAIAKGIAVEEGKSLKRTLNATLLSLMRKRRVEQDQAGKWLLVKQEAPSAVTDGASQ